MMLRVLSLVLISAPAVFVTLWFSGNPGQIVLDWLGWHIETNVPIFLLALLIVFVALFALEHLVSSLLTLPLRVRTTRRTKGMEKGIAALIDSIDAAGAGDIEKGRRLGAEAARQLGRTDLAERLDRLMPRPVIKPAAPQALKSSPGTKGKPSGLSRFWSRLRGQRAAPPRSVRPAMPVPIQPIAAASPEPPLAPLPVAAFDESQVKDAVRAGDWDGALTLIKTAGPGAAKHWRSFILTSQATSLAPAAPDQARDLAGQVVAADPSYFAAQDLAVRLDVAAGNRAQAEALLKSLWPHHPSFHLLTLCTPLWAAGDPALHAAWLESLARTNPDHAESHLAEGALAVATGHWGAARRHLVAAIKAAPSVHAFRLMIEVEEKDGGDLAAIDMWKRRESTAQSHPTWSCQACGSRTDSWQPVCPICSTVGSLDWK